MVQSHQVIEHILAHLPQDRMAHVRHQPLTQKLGQPGEQHDRQERARDPVEAGKQALVERALHSLIDHEDLDVEGDGEERIRGNGCEETFLVRRDVAAEATHQLGVVERAVFLLPAVGGDP